MPSYGFGISTVAFENHGELVRPIEAYTFFSWPFARLTNRLDMTSDFGMGLVELDGGARNTRDADRTGLNLNAGLTGGYTSVTCRRREPLCTGGLDSTHRSNGGLVQPNQGINVLGPKVTVHTTSDPTSPTGSIRVHRRRFIPHGT